MLKFRGLLLVQAARHCGNKFNVRPPKNEDGPLGHAAAAKPSWAYFNTADTTCDVHMVQANRSKLNR